MKSDLEMWLQEVGERSLKEVGIRKGYVALDFWIQFRQLYDSCCARKNR